MNQQFWVLPEKMCSDTCQKQGFQVFLFVSRTLWVVLGSGMGWRVRLVPLLPCLVQIFTQWDPAVPKYQIVIFINVLFTKV